MMRSLSKNPGRRGAVLLLVLWAIFVLTGAIMVYAAYARQTLVTTNQSYNDTDARGMANSGMALGLHPLVTKETPVLAMKESSDPGFRVKMVSEGGKLNLNFVLVDDERKLMMFKRWMEGRGIEFNDRERIVDCLMDYIDADNLKRINGQEDTEGYHPPNRGRLQSVEELEQVWGVEMLTSQGGWKDELTVFSNGPIDVTSANFNIMRLLPGIGDGNIQRFIQWRQGDDQIDGTLDDPAITKLDQIQGFLGLNKTQFGELGGLIGLKDNTWNIISEGWSGKVHRQIEVVARKGGQNPTILSWKE
jgi:general secretion pathway protein K